MKIKKIFCFLSSLALIAGLIACGNDAPETGSMAQAGRSSEEAPGTFSDMARSEGVSHGMGSKSSGGSSSAIVPLAGAKVERSTAENGYTVGELFARAADLNKQKVTVQGQVVKISRNIMGRNWIHIQDGTGDPMKNTHDLVITSSALVEKGSVVSLEGVLAADKDFGAGYRYDVIIENAVVVK
jgi:hypothetical protein